ncbi:MAG: hypothetical protein AB8B49_10995 [Nitratireductor sp.]
MNTHLKQEISSSACSAGSANSQTNSIIVLKNRLKEIKIKPDDFKENTTHVCDEFGSKVILEIPSQLVTERKGSAVAILCPNKNDYTLLFAICYNSRKKLQVLDAKKVPKKIVELVWSYASVMSRMPPLEKHEPLN